MKGAAEALEALRHMRNMEQDLGQKIDPKQEHNFASIALGYFIAHGFSIKQARRMSDLYAVYDAWVVEQVAKAFSE